MNRTRNRWNPSLFTFPRKGTETVSAEITTVLDAIIITYISPQGDGNVLLTSHRSEMIQPYYLPFLARGRKQVLPKDSHPVHELSLFTFPRKGTEIRRLSLYGNSDGLLLLTFPRKGTGRH